jgi:hypothetical protein
MEEHYDNYMMVGDRALESLYFQEASKNYNLALQSAEAKSEDYGAYN